MTQAPSFIRESTIQLLTEHIASLPHPEYGTINVLPFSHDSEQVRLIKRHVCEAITDLLISHGKLKTENTGGSASASGAVPVKCRASGDVLVDLDVHDGVAMVDAAGFIAAVSRLNPACPHNAITIDDHRLKMESDAFREMGIDTGLGYGKVENR